MLGGRLGISLGMFVLFFLSISHLCQSENREQFLRFLLLILEYLAAGWLILFAFAL
jgi:hypothetical protein